jgi:bifunctional enzyme CysN/CysC/sulfate adenylyltransferase subunit 1
MSQSTLTADSIVPPPISQISDREALEYLERHQQKDLLRFTVVGSVDDGKSTLIGRLLHDTGQVYEDQLHAVRKATAKKGEEDIDFSLFTDGLKAEREQGITIDVAYRYFTTQNRKFIIADTPGHVQYTRNMATGASTAEIAVILLDARLGVLPQSRRHAFIARLLGIPRLVACINKMDLVEYDRAVFEKLRDDFLAFAGNLGFTEVVFIPVSAKRGDNIVSPSQNMGFYAGPTLLEFLERVPLVQKEASSAFRFPVQYVLRPHLNYRGFAGTIASGTVRPKDTVMVLPSRRTTTITHVDLYDKELPEAQSPMSVTLRLADEIDISRGDMLVPVDAPPSVVTRFDAMLVWLGRKRLDPGKTYLLKHTTQVVRAEVLRLEHLVDLETLEKVNAETFSLNDIGKVTIRTRRPLFVDPYEQNRATGAFILIDSVTNDTVAAGMIGAISEGQGGESDNPRNAGSWVSARERRERLGQSGALVTIAKGPQSRELGRSVERSLFDASRVAVLLDLESEPYATATTPTDVARQLIDAGLLVVASAVSPKALADFESNLEGRPRYHLEEGDPGDESVGRKVLRTLEELGVLESNPV